MIAKTVWKKEMEFDGHSESGHHLVFDAGAAHAKYRRSLATTHSGDHAEDGANQTVEYIRIDRSQVGR